MEEGELVQAEELPFPDAPGDLFQEDQDEPALRRAVCQNCERPKRVCWCPHLPEPRISIARRVLILQHPKEADRGVRTALIAARAVAEDRCRIYRGRKFPGADEELGRLLSSPKTHLLFPGEGSVDLRQLSAEQVENLVVLDGTWDEAKKLFTRNPVLAKLPRVSLSVDCKSEYVVRTQPSDGCLSTLEAVAHSLAQLEGQPEVVEALLRPLRAMCNAQVRHGAVNHDSRHFKRENAQFVKKNDYKRKGKRNL